MTHPKRIEGLPQAQGANYVGGNFILDRIPLDDLLTLQPLIQVLHFAPGDVLYPGGAERDLEFAIFPISAVMSMFAVLADGSTIEAGTAGREGMVGAQCALGSTRMFERWIAQVPGWAARISLTDLRRLLERNRSLRFTIQLYIQAYMALLSQSIACNNRHPLIERCARWLLLTHDRAGRDEFTLTHEFLATMLGVRRPGVSVAAATLANAGFISYVRGAITITDRLGLESASCECYRVMRHEFERLFGEALSAYEIN